MPAPFKLFALEADRQCKMAHVILQYRQWYDNQSNSIVEPTFQVLDLYTDTMIALGRTVLVTNDDIAF